MNINYVEMIGCLAAILGTLSLIPQVIKTWKSSSVRDISLSMYVIIAADSILWLSYGVYYICYP